MDQNPIVELADDLERRLKLVGKFERFAKFRLMVSQWESIIAALRALPQEQIDKVLPTETPGEFSVAFDTPKPDCNYGVKVAAIPAALPEGYVRVPKEPTEEMIAAFADHVLLNPNIVTSDEIKAGYKAAIAAAQGERKP